MSVEGLEPYSKDELIAELIHRQTFVGIVIYHREDAKDGRLDPGEIVMTKSPALTREGVEGLLQVGHSLVAAMFELPAVASEPNMAISLRAEYPPLRVDEGRAVRVGNSRIALDLVVEQYENGMTPEDIVRAYDTRDLADVYAAIAFYLRHRAQVGTYLKQRREEAEALRAKIESQRPRLSRDELLARAGVTEKNNAPVGQ